MLTVLEAKAMPLRFELQWFVEDYQIVQNRKTTQNLQMFICLTGSQLAAARALASLSRQQLATRAGLSYHSIRAWERSSNSIPEATYDHLCRAVKALEAAGVRFSDDGVYLHRSAPRAGTVRPLYLPQSFPVSRL